MAFNVSHSTQGHRQMTNKKEIFTCTHRPGLSKSKQAHTWYQRARLQGGCVWLLYQGGSVCGSRSCECACWWVQRMWWWAEGCTATRAMDQPSRDTEGRSHSSAVHSSQGQHSLSGHLKGRGNWKMCLFWISAQQINIGNMLTSFLINGLILCTHFCPKNCQCTIHSPKISCWTANMCWVINSAGGI